MNRKQLVIIIVISALLITGAATGLVVYLIKRNQDPVEAPPTPAPTPTPAPAPTPVTPSGGGGGGGGGGYGGQNGNDRQNRRYSDPKPPRSDGFAGANGLQNLGNTCYMNSAIQCMMRVRPLVGYFLDDIYHTEMNASSVYKGEIVDEWANLTKAYFAPNSQGYVTPVSFKSTIGNHHAAFNNFGQQDSQEFLLTLLNSLNAELNRVTVPNQVEVKPLLGNPTKDELLNAFQPVWESESQSIISDMFRGSFHSQIKCTAGHVSHKAEDMMSIEVPIVKNQPDGLHLDACINEFQRTESLGPENLINCTACNARVLGEKNLSILTTPRYLIVLLKRFERNNKGEFTRINTPVFFPLKAFTPIRGQPDSYKLVALSWQSGSLTGGHYKAYSLVEGDYTPDKQPAWYEFNDSYVNKVSESTLLSEDIQSNVYFLIYEREEVQGADKDGAAMEGGDAGKGGENP